MPAAPRRVYRLAVAAGLLSVVAALVWLVRDSNRLQQSGVTATAQPFQVRHLDIGFQAEETLEDMLTGDLFHPDDQGDLSLTVPPYGVLWLRAE